MVCCPPTKWGARPNRCGRWTRMATASSRLTSSARPAAASEPASAPDDDETPAAAAPREAVTMAAHLRIDGELRNRPVLRRDWVYPQSRGTIRREGASAAPDGDARFEV